MKKRNIIVFDTETTGLIPGHAEIIQLSAVHVDPVRLEITDEFDSMMKPLHPENASQEALDIHGYTLEQLAEAPHPKTVWKDFCDFVNRYNPEGNMWTAPLPAGYNVGFDLGHAHHCFKSYGPFDKKKNQQTLFHYNSIDVMEQAWSWFENDASIRNMRLTTLMEYFGISSDAAHNSLYDTKVTAEVLIRFLKLHRNLREKYGIKFKNCMKNWTPDE
jgi:DNA polymerase III epsilon subunit-like protein